MGLHPINITEVIKISDSSTGRVNNAQSHNPFIKGDKVNVEVKPGLHVNRECFIFNGAHSAGAYSKATIKVDSFERDATDEVYFGIMNTNWMFFVVHLLGET